MFIGNIEHNTIIPKIKLSWVSFAPHSRIFLVVGSSISTARTTVWNWTASLKFYGSTKGVPCSSWRHVVDLFVFCGILASFLDWISSSVTVVNLCPESSLSVNMQVARKILGAKIEIVNCFFVVCLRNEESKLFSESSIAVPPLKLI